MGYNLDDNTFDSKAGGVAIFNNGEAGVVENVTISVKKKTPEDKEKAPDYKLVFTDEAGASTELSFWYVEKDTEYKSIDEQVAAQGKSMKHILNVLYGESSRPSVGGDNPRQFLDSGMKAIRDGLSPGVTFRVFANFGIAPKGERKGKVSKYIGIRSWVPFMESMSTPLAETRLKASDFDAMFGVEPTPMSAPGTTSTTSVEEDW